MLRKMEFGIPCPEAITLSRFISAIDKLLRYVDVDDLTIRDWLEAESMTDALHDIDQMLKANVPGKIYKLVKM